MNWRQQYTHSCKQDDCGSTPEWLAAKLVSHNLSPVSVLKRNFCDVKKQLICWCPLSAEWGTQHSWTSRAGRVKLWQVSSMQLQTNLRCSWTLRWVSRKLSKHAFLPSKLCESESLGHQSASSEDALDRKHPASSGLADLTKTLDKCCYSTRLPAPIEISSQQMGFLPIVSLESKQVRLNCCSCTNVRSDSQLAQRANRILTKQLWISRQSIYWSISPYRSFNNPLNLYITPSQLAAFTPVFNMLT